MIKILDVTPTTFLASQWTRANAVASVTGGAIRFLATAAGAYVTLSQPLPLSSGDNLVVVAEVVQGTPSTSADIRMRLTPAMEIGETLNPAVARRYVIDQPIDAVLDSNPAQFLRFDGFAAGDAVLFSRIAVYAIPSRLPMLDRLAVEVETAGSGFQLDASRLNSGRFGPDNAAVAWRDILGECRSISILRGATTAGLTTSVEVGTATLDMLVPGDTPPGLDLRPGAPIRIRTQAGDSPIFTGQLQPVREEFRAVPRRPVTISGVDAVSQLAGTTLYGAAGPEPWNERARRLADRVPGLDWRFHPAAAGREFPWMARTVTETDATSHLQTTTTTAGVRWHIDARNTLVIGTDWLLPEAHRPRAIFRDVELMGDPAPLSYLDIGVTYDVGSTVNTLTITNTAATWDTEQGAWHANDTNHGPYVDPTAAATWGARTETITTAAQIDYELDAGGAPYPRADLDALARDVLDTVAEAELIITHITVDMTHRIELAAAFDIEDDLTVVYAGTTQRSRVIGLQHTITPHRWTTTLYLRKAA